MNTTSIIIGVALVLIFVLPVWFSNFNRNQKMKKKIEILNKIVLENGYQLSESENFNDLVLGIDKQKNFVFYLNLQNNTQIAVDLSTVKKCDKHEFNRSVTLKTGNHKVIEKIEMVFNPIDLKIPKTIFEIYNTENSRLYLVGELLFCEKWVNLINNHITELRKTK